MTNYAPSDCSIGLKQETSFGEKVTVDRHIELTSASLQKEVNYLQSDGLRVGRVGPGWSDRIPGSVSVGGDIEFDANSLDTALMLEAALGSLDTGGTDPYYYLATCKQGGLPPSYTIQMGIPIGSNATSVAAHTFTGMMCNQLKINAANGAILGMTTSWVGKDMVTAESLVTPAYTDGSNLFTFFGASLALGGSVTLPTKTSKASGGTDTANVRDCSLTVDNGLPDNTPTFGSGGTRGAAPPYGVRQVTGQFTAEFDSTTLRDASLDGTGLALLLEFTGGDDELLQIVLPKIGLDANIPNPNGGEIITQQFDFTAYEDGGDGLAYLLVQNKVDPS